MSIRLDLPKELERELTTEATQMGVSLAEYVFSPLGRLLRLRQPRGQNWSPIGNARGSLVRGLVPPIANRSPVNSVIRRKNGCGNSPCISSIPMYSLTFSANMLQR